MLGKFRKFVIGTNMDKPTFMSGHTYTLNRPCTLHALYNDRTGTIVLESAWCDGHTYFMNDLDKKTVQDFYDDVVQHIVQIDFDEPEPLW